MPYNASYVSRQTTRCGQGLDRRPTLCWHVYSDWSAACAVFLGAFAVGTRLVSAMGRFLAIKAQTPEDLMQFFVEVGAGALVVSTQFLACWEMPSAVAIQLLAEVQVQNAPNRSSRLPRSRPGGPPTARYAGQKRHRWRRK